MCCSTLTPNHCTFETITNPIAQCVSTYRNQIHEFLATVRGSAQQIVVRDQPQDSHSLIS